MGEMHSFQAEVSQVLRLVVGSLYSNPEIFLRELISNASDALDKLRFEAIADPKLLEGDPELVIRVAADEAAGTLTLSDNGIGMSQEELAKNLGTIAHSGSKAFVEQLQRAQEAAKQGDAVQLIGQFGVGFYSAFLVADRVDVVSRRAGEAGAARWSSDAKEGYTLEPAERAGRGTDVVLHLKEDARDYLKRWRIEELVRRYSDYVAHPIELLEPPAPKDQAGEAADERAEGEPTYRRLNQGSALWQRSPKEVTDEQYTDFYKHLTHDFEAPLARRHFHVEGTQMFAGLLFIPKRPPIDLFDPEVKRGIRLHVRRVFVMNDAEELLPRWLRFVRGVLDSEDLPLNVSREILQDSKAVRLMRRQVVSQTLSMLEELASERPEDYASFFRGFGAVLKEGLHFEPDQEKRLAELVRYESSESEDKLTSLKDYVARMKEGQTSIYYVTGAERRLVERSPHLEALTQRGYEVLYMTDPVDPFVVETLRAYADKPLVNAMSESLKLDEGGEESAQEARDVAHQGLIERFQSVLSERVSQVRTSTRLKGSPVCLVIPEGGLAPHLERLMRAQQLGVPAQKRVLELNSEHPLIQRLDELNREPERAEDVTEWIGVLYDQALLAEGSPLDDPARLAQRLTELMTRAAG
ncbi:MAG: molecular chaperone HtpG [Polyangiaceae bacterium]|nr:molecular chaperone HtpG [Polyangiaceae bacterium]MCW5791288.1 molecular chaperone HtpG [Polyangiaceae bacterium]